MFSCYINYITCFSFNNYFSTSTAGTQMLPSFQRGAPEAGLHGSNRTGFQLRFSGYEKCNYFLVESRLWSSPNLSNEKKETRIFFYFFFCNLVKCFSVFLSSREGRAGEQRLWSD